jgi:signal transduction histidine kinase
MRLKAGRVVGHSDEKARGRGFDEALIRAAGHELRNALNGIIVTSQLALRRSVDEDTRELLRRVLRAGHDMEKAIEQMSMVAKLGLAGEALASPALDLQVVVGRALDRRKRYRQLFSLATSGDTTGAWNEELVSQCVLCLLDTAADHPVLGDRIAVSIDGDSPGQVEVRVGPPADDHPESWLPVAPPIGGKLPLGTAPIGLVIADQLASRCGGVLEIRAGDASEMCIRLSLPRNPLGPRSGGAAATSSGP